jgi:hypothetical protein
MIYLIAVARVVNKHAQFCIGVVQSIPPYPSEETHSNPVGVSGQTVKIAGGGGRCLIGSVSAQNRATKADARYQMSAQRRVLSVSVAR